MDRREAGRDRDLSWSCWWRSSTAIPWPATPSPPASAGPEAPLPGRGRTGAGRARRRDLRLFLHGPAGAGRARPGGERPPGPWPDALAAGGAGEPGCEEDPQLLGMSAAFAPATQIKTLVRHHDARTADRHVSLPREGLLERGGRCFLLARDEYGWRAVPTIKTLPDRVEATLDFDPAPGRPGQPARRVLRGVDGPPSDGRRRRRERLCLDHAPGPTAAGRQNKPD